MVGRSYGQFCGVARALDIVGERWALLVVRDLLVGPKRFTDLRRGLPRIPTNVLSARLKELEDAGVVARRVLPRPAGGVAYELTDYGRDLDEIVLRLGRWGARSLDEPGPDDVVTADSMIMALRSTFRPEAARGRRIGYELRLGEVVLHARVDDGAIAVREGVPPGSITDLVLSTRRPLRPMLTGEVSPAEAIRSGRVDVEGNPALLDRFVELFSIPPRPRSAG